MSRSVSYQLRLSDDEKTAAFSVFRELGITPAQAIRLFLRQVVEVGGLPFEVKKPTPETVAAMMEARAMTATRYGSAKELFDGLDQQASKAKPRSPAKKG